MIIEGENKVKIIAHRGYWNKNIQNNSSKALRLALEHGYGFESDLRDYAGRLVVSHNIADSNSQQADEIFRWLSEFDDKCCFAINIKADGLKELIKEQLLKNNLKNYFTFDMSVPQMVEYAECGLRFFTRQSEVERTPIRYVQAAGVWIDGFWGEDWITADLINGHLERGKEVCIVSPDLHHRKYLPFWEKISNFGVNSRSVMLCTDYPDEAKAFLEQ